MFAVDLVTGRLLQRSFQGSWGNWRDRGLGPGGHRLGAPSATSWGTRRLDVAATDQETSSLVQLYFDGAWHGPVRQDCNSATVMADANPRSTPIPVSAEARAAD